MKRFSVLLAGLAVGLMLSGLALAQCSPHYGSNGCQGGGCRSCQSAGGGCSASAAIEWNGNGWSQTDDGNLPPAAKSEARNFTSDKVETVPHNDAVVRIRFGHGTGQANDCSGFISDRDAKEKTSIVVTCAHGLVESVHPLVYTAKGEEFEADIVEWDADQDIAVLKIEDAGVEPIEFAASDPVIGEKIWIAARDEERGFNMSSGTVAGFGKNKGCAEATFFDTTARVREGMSGAPIYNERGVFGLVSVNGGSKYDDGSAGPVIYRVMCRKDKGRRLKFFSKIFERHLHKAEKKAEGGSQKHLAPSRRDAPKEREHPSVRYERTTAALWPCYCHACADAKVRQPLTGRSWAKKTDEDIADLQNKADAAPLPVAPPPSPPPAAAEPAKPQAKESELAPLAAAAIIFVGLCIGGGFYAITRKRKS